MAKFKKIILDGAKSDKRQRRAAKHIVKRLKRYVNREGKRAFREISRDRRYMIPASDFIEYPVADFFPALFDPAKVRFYFVRGGTGENPYYSRDKHASGEKYAVTLPFLTDDGSLERIEDRITVKQDTIMHELTHMLDDLRTRQSKDLIDMRQADGEYAEAGEGYYNEPFELNAYFQQAIGDFEEFVERNPETLAALSDNLRDFRSFREFAFDQLFDDGFIEHLTDENRERMIKRLYKFYEDFKKTDAFLKQVAN